MTEQGPHDEEDKQRAGETPGRDSLAELYETMSRVLRENMERAGALSEEAFERALKETREWAGRLREHYAEDITRVSGYLRRDWHAGIRFARDQYKRNFDFDRLQVGALDLLFRLAKAAGEQLEVFASRINERLTYKTGEIAGAGALQCTQCEQGLSFDKATRIPPCPKCRGTSFRRSF